MADFLIYGLRDPVTNEIRYVGKSSTGRSRPNRHAKLAANLSDQTHRATWIRSLISSGRVYEIIVLQRLLTADGIDTAERWWIAIGRAALGDRLTNGTAGGDGLSDPSSETRKRMSDAQKVRYARPGESERLAYIGRVRTPEQIKKQADSLRRALTPELRERIAKKLREYSKDPSVRERMIVQSRKTAEGLRGIPRSQEVIEKIKATWRAKRYRPSMRLNLARVR